MTTLRIISDLHYDQGINQDEYFDEKIGQKFLKKYADITLTKYFTNQRVFFTGGNHDVYVKGFDTIYDINNMHKKEFPLTHSFWKYINNDWVWILGTDVALIGSTFYTDYEYNTWTLESFNSHLKAWDTLINAYGFKTEYEEVTDLSIDQIIKENQLIAQGAMNDFSWGYEAPGQHLTPYTYRELHLQSKKEILRCYNEIINQNPKAKVILMTHHCLSEKCIDERFYGSKNNCSYISDLENWLCENMPNLRLVISGHVHCRKDFTFGKNDKRYIINACGYLPYNEPFKGKVQFNPNLIIRIEDL